MCNSLYVYKINTNSLFISSECPNLHVLYGTVFGNLNFEGSVRSIHCHFYPLQTRKSECRNGSWTNFPACGKLIITRTLYPPS